jgi:hypothetical protein
MELKISADGKVMDKLKKWGECHVIQRTIGSG